MKFCCYCVEFLILEKIIYKKSGIFNIRVFFDIKDIFVGERFLICNVFLGFVKNGIIEFLFGRVWRLF